MDRAGTRFRFLYMGSSMDSILRLLLPRPRYRPERFAEEDDPAKYLDTYPELLPSRASSYFQKSKSSSLNQLASRFSSELTDTGLRNALQIYKTKAGGLSLDELKQRLVIFGFMIELAELYLKDPVAREELNTWWLPRQIGSRTTLNGTDQALIASTQRERTALLGARTELEIEMERRLRVLSSSTSPSPYSSTLTPISSTLLNTTPAASSVSSTALGTTTTTKPGTGIMGLSETDSRYLIFGLIGLVVLLILVAVVVSAS